MEKLVLKVGNKVLSYTSIDQNNKPITQVVNESDKTSVEQLLGREFEPRISFVKAYEPTELVRESQINTFVARSCGQEGFLRGVARAINSHSFPSINGKYVVAEIITD